MKMTMVRYVWLTAVLALTTLGVGAVLALGQPPGRLAETCSVGESTFGRSLTGSARYATTPNTAMPSIKRLVAMGRRMKTSEIFKPKNPLTGFARRPFAAAIGPL